MYNQSGLTSDLYGNIFRMREFFIKDMVLKNNIKEIKQRQSNAKTSLLKPTNIYTVKKSTSSPRIGISKIPIKTFLPFPSIQTQKNSSPIKTSPPLLKSRTKFSNVSVSKFNYQFKVTSGQTDKLYQTHKNYVNHFLQAKRRDSLNKSIHIEKENEKFGKKLNRVSSPLSKSRLDESFRKNKEYAYIAKKIKPEKDLNVKKINYVKSRLPPLFLKKPNNAGMKKFNFEF